VKEGDILKQVRDYLRWRGWLVYRIQQGLGCHRGMSDLICVKDGRVLFLEIKASQVRLVGEKGEQLGVMPLFQAREVAKAQGLDLVEVAPTAVPPVCRLLDYGKHKYEQAKKDGLTPVSVKEAAERARAVGFVRSV